MLFCPDLELWCPEFEFPDAAGAGAKFREATASDLLRECADATASVSRGRKRLRGCLCCCRRSASFLDVLLLLVLLLLLLTMLLPLPVFLFLVVPLLPDAAAAAAVPVTPHRWPMAPPPLCDPKPPKLWVWNMRPPAWPPPKPPLKELRILRLQWFSLVMLF